MPNRIATLLMLAAVALFGGCTERPNNAVDTDPLAVPESTPTTPDPGGLEPETASGDAVIDVDVTGSPRMSVGGSGEAGSMMGGSAEAGSMRMPVLREAGSR